MVDALSFASAGGGAKSSSRLTVLDCDGRGGHATGGLFSLDGVHPTTVGYGLIAQEVINIMQLASVTFLHANTVRSGPIIVDFERLIRRDTLITQSPASGFCCPPSEPDVPIPEHPALHMVMSSRWAFGLGVRLARRVARHADLPGGKNFGPAGAALPALAVKRTRGGNTDARAWFFRQPTIRQKAKWSILKIVWTRRAGSGRTNSWSPG
jgi:hypothetical protein